MTESIFVSKHYEILNGMPENGCCAWGKDGYTIIIKDRSKFEEDVMPQLVKGNFASYVRQLHNYGFKKSSPPDPSHLAYTNPLFKKDRRDMIAQIKRKPSTPKESKIGGETKKPPEDITNKKRPLEYSEPLLADYFLDFDRNEPIPYYAEASSAAPAVPNFMDTPLNLSSLDDDERYDTKFHFDAFQEFLSKNREEDEEEEVP